MIQPLTTFADNSSGIGALGLDGKAFLIQLVTFILAYLVLQRYAFKPILKVMRDRSDTIEAGVRLGEEMRAERSKLETEIEKQLHEARARADDIIANAEDSGRQAIRE